MNYENAKRMGFDEYMKNYVCKDLIKNEIEKLDRKILKNKSKEKYSYKENEILEANKKILNKLLKV